jgi:hypothetical protein
MTFFNHVVFVGKNFNLLFFQLSQQFLLIFPINNFYFKFDLSGMKFLSRFILKTYSIHWMRVSFRGKGYRLRKFKTLNKVTLNFGHSHWAKIALDYKIFFFKKLRRQNYLCFSKYYNLYKNFKLQLKFFKRLNSYTKRGLRLRKQYIKRRFGKISQVVSSLH